MTTDEDEPETYQCSNCDVWSKFVIQFPKKWADNSKGYFCENALRSLKCLLIGHRWELGNFSKYIQSPNTSKSGFFYTYCQHCEAMGKISYEKQDIAVIYSVRKI